jgi:WD40 repeat protein/uncharacterized caspase-like protein
MEYGHARAIKAGCAAAQGKYFLTASDDLTAVVWDTEKLTPIRQFPIHNTWIKGIACSPISAHALAVFEPGTGDQTPTAILYDVLTGTTLWTVRRVNLGRPSFSPDGKFVAIPTYDGPVRMFSAETGQELKAFSSEGAVIPHVAFSDDGQLLAASPWSDETLRVWNVSSGAIVSRVPRSGLGHAVAFVEGGKKVVIAGNPKSLLIDLKDKREIGAFPAAELVTPINDTEYLFAGRTGDEEVLHWQRKAARQSTLKAKLDTQKGQGRVILATYLSRENAFLTVYDDRVAQVYSIGVHDRASGQLKRSFVSDAAGSRVVGTTAAAVSLDGRWLALSHPDDHTSIVELSGNRRARIPGANVKAVLGGFITLARQHDGALILRLWDSDRQEVRALREFKRGDVLGFVTNVSAAKDQILLYHRGAGGGHVRHLTTGDVLSRFKLRGDVNAVLSPDGRRVLVSGGGNPDEAAIYSHEGEQEKVQVLASNVQDAQWSPDGLFVALGGERHGVSIWNAKTGLLQKHLFSFNIISTWQAGLVRVRFSASGRYLLAVDGEMKVRVWDVASGMLAYSFAGLIDAAEDASWIDDHAIVLTGRGTTVTMLGRDGRFQTSWLIQHADQRWFFTTDEQRFDSDDLDRIESVHWLMPDDPLRPLRPEIFMRDYFEPRLLPRLLECHKAERTRPDACAKEFKPVRALASLNRAQPEVRVLSVAPEPGAADEVSVTVEVRGVEARFGTTGQEKASRSGAYDLRLFRDGQLVGQAPDLKEPELLEALDPEADVARWREAHRLVDGVGRKEVTFRHIRLPKREQGDKVEFSAYAFNVDRVKSATASMPYTVPQSMPARDRRAYVVAVGVSAYEDPAWDLRYADDDARRFVEVLEPRLRATGQYKDVVSVPLLADWEERDQVRTVTTATATKQNVKAVLDILAGRAVAEEVRRALPNGMKLERAGPDDLVLITYSSHGYADRAGNFYLFPYDIGSNTGRAVSAEILKQAISSAELSAWLRDLDAGELIMVVDACHSAASVESPEFKPGPMGSRGLGQLAYDKGMRILASTRADDVAWESARTRQGLLSYALVHDGLEEWKADFRPADGRIGVQEWLEYAAQRVPQLYAEAMTKGDTPNAAAPGTGATEQGWLVAFDSFTRGPRYITRPGASPQTQQPSLFNYKRGDDPLVARR